MPKLCQDKIDSTWLLIFFLCNLSYAMTLSNDIVSAKSPRLAMALETESGKCCSIETNV